jgi:hypothetical protein
MTKEQLQELTSRAIAADRKWSTELYRLFGKDACNARYTKAGKGKAGSRLRELHDASRLACESAHQACIEYRKE